MPGSPAPLTVKVRTSEAVDNGAMTAGKDVALTLSVGATTAPLTATVRDTFAGLGNPVEADTVTLPERETAVDQAAKRTTMLWLSVPPCGKRVRTLGAKLTPSADNSNPAGALTLTLPGNPPPLTVKPCDADTVLTRVEKAASLLVLTAMAGITVPLNLTMRLVVLSVETTKSPDRGPLGALVARRTAMLVAATALLLRESVRLVPKLVKPVPNRAIS